MLVLVALALRLPTAGDQSYWLDEVYSAQIVAGSFGHAWSSVQLTENTPPLYYLAGWAWTHIFGQGELGLRSLSAVAGALAVIPTVWLTRTTAPRGTTAWVALLAGLLLVVNPLAQWFSQEARAYGLFTLVAALAWAALAAALARPTPTRLWLWAAAAVVASWTHYFGVVLLVVGGAALVLAEIAERRGWAAGLRPMDSGSSAADRLHPPHPARSVEVKHAGGAQPQPHVTSPPSSARLLAPPLIASLVGAAALVPIAVNQHSTAMYEAIANVKGLGARIAETPKQFAVGYSAPLEYVLGALIAVVIIALVVAAAWPRDGRATRATVLLGLVAVVWVLPLIALIVGFDVVLTRNYVLLLPPLLALAAIGAWRVGRWAVVALLLVAVVQLVVVIAVQTTPAHQRDDWRGAMQAADEGGPLARPALLLVSRYQPKVAEYYAPTARVVNPGEPVAVRSIALVDRPLKAGEDAPARLRPPAPPAPGMRLVREARNAQYRVIVWRSDVPVEVTPSALLGLVPDGGPRNAVLRP